MNRCIAIVTFTILYCSFNTSADEVSYSLDGPYFNIGFNITHHFGKRSRTSFGPEFSFGTVFEEYKIVSGAIAFEMFTKNNDWVVKTKFQGGTYLAGGSIGPVFGKFKRKKHFGMEVDLWAGLFLYGVATYKIIPENFGISTSGKLKIPVSPLFRNYEE
jgi:hypothetical protein